MTIDVTVQLATINCGVCGGVYAITERHRRQCEEKAKTWYCPYCGNSWGYGHLTPKATREKRELRERAERAEAQAAEAQGAARRAAAEAGHQARRAATYKGHLTRTKNRLALGFCPKCDAEFPDLETHLREAHPDYTETEE